MVRKKNELECLLMILIYFNSKFKVTCKNGDFEYRCIRTHFEKSMRILIFQPPFCCFLFHQNTLTTLCSLRSCVLWSLFFVVKPSDAFRNGSFQHKKKQTKQNTHAPPPHTPPPTHTHTHTPLHTKNPKIQSSSSISSLLLTHNSFWVSVITCIK